MSDILLTIAIPTYNRSAYLERCLNAICSQLNHNASEIELIVSDNASVDNTPEVVRKFQQKFPITYLRNSENKGADFNVAQCYNAASGKYIVAFGDDDVFVSGALNVLLKTLSENDAGVVYLKNYAIGNTVFFDKPVNPDKVEITVIFDKTAFLKRVSYFCTFLSGNVINRKALIGVDTEAYRGSNLGHVPLVLTAVNSFSKNIIIESPLVAMQTENTGGYSLFTTFGTNFMAILDAVYSQKNDAKYKDLIIKDMLLTFFPAWIQRYKSGNRFSKENNIFAIMHPLFKNYSRFWLYNYPLIKLNGLFSTIYYKAVKFRISFLKKKI